MTAAEQIEKIVCPQCCAVLDASDNFCRHCGQPTRESADGRSGHIVTTPKKSSWVESRATVLVMLFVVLGPLALPLLWRSREFSLPWKIVLTVVMVALTALILYLIWYVIYQSLEPLRRLHMGEL
jgi:hypothetical protein